MFVDIANRSPDLGDPLTNAVRDARGLDEGLSGGSFSMSILRECASAIALPTVREIGRAAVSRMFSSRSKVHSTGLSRWTCSGVSLCDRRSGRTVELFVVRELDELYVSL